MKLSPRVLYQEIAGESVLLDLASEQYFGLNAVGTRVWRCLESGLDLESIIRAVESEFAVDSATARADIQALLRQLLEAGLIVAD